MLQSRIVQVNAGIQRELSRLIPTLKDPRLSGLVSVVRADTSGDLGLCKVYISSLEDSARAAKGLQSAAGLLRGELGRALSLRHCPRLEFIADDSIERGAHILSIMNGLEDLSGSDSDSERN